MTITVDRLREVLRYDQQTGVFVWAVRPARNVFSGSIAGTVEAGRNGRMYRRINIDKRPYFAHRLAWLWVHGQWPTAEIDHIDNDGLNNALLNLREATRSENSCNRGVSKNNKSGLKGVHWCKRKRKWRAVIGVDGRLRYLGYHPTPDQAHAAYCKAAEKFHGSFARAA